MRQAILSNFKIIRPRYESQQTKTLEWLSNAHVAADPSVNVTQMNKYLARFGCSADKIASRGHELKDFTHENWNEMEIFNFDQKLGGIEERTGFFQKSARAIFERFYAEDQTGPSDLIHVTCTGYASPSAAQELVAKKNWGSSTRVTHLYHMGCYAAFPALRLASGFLASSLLETRHVDIVHTELCSLHLDPRNHTPEQLVVQTLFSDGFIRYSMNESGAGLKILALQEETIPESKDQMTWNTADWGMQMTLSREVPETISKNIQSFVERLCSKAKVSMADDKEKVIFAIHPGGPKIIDRIEEKLGLSSGQTLTSRAVLKSYGNMSSATLPHIWSRLLQDPSVQNGTVIISLAFGPGLTFCGGVFRKV